MPRSTWQARISGAALALLVQLSLIAAAILSLTRPVSLPRPHETILLLRPQPPAEPPVLSIDARGPPSSRTSPTPQVTPPENTPSGNSLPAPAPDLQAFGRALFGCAPERYGELSPEDRAHCPKPGEGMAREQDLANPPRSHAKDEPYWQEQFRRARVVYGECLGGAQPVPRCLMEQARAERQREQEFDQQEADRKAAALREPVRPAPASVRSYEAFRRDHPVK